MIIALQERDGESAFHCLKRAIGGITENAERMVGVVYLDEENKCPVFFLFFFMPGLTQKIKTNKI